MLNMQFSTFWDIFAIPFGYVMQGFNFICRGNYLLSLLLFALVVKLLTLPFAIKQQKNQIKGAMLRPKMMLIEKKYAGRNDRPTLQKKQQEMMELQQKEGFSPLSGCFPLLIQFPIIIALYRIIRMPLKYVCNLADAVIVSLYNTLNPEATVEKLGKIPGDAQIEMIGQLHQNPSLLDGTGLSVDKLPNFNVFGGIDLGLKPSFTQADRINLWLIAIPVLCAVLSYLSMWISRKLNDTGMNGANAAASDPGQKVSMTIMNLMMPLMSGWIAFITPGAVGVYWVYTSLLAIAQTVILAKVMPLPRYTDEQIREIQRAMKNQKGNPDRGIVGSSVDENGKPKSLHYIDDEDEY